MMGRLPESPIEVRLAATLFLLLLGAANFFGAWQVKSFASFSPAGVAASVAPPGGHDLGMCDACRAQESSGSGMSMHTMAREVPVELSSLDRPAHWINRDLLVQDTHVHLPAYALTAAALSLVVFGLALSSRLRVLLVACAFAAPFADFAGLWGAHLLPRRGGVFGALAVAGGFLMGAVYLAVLAMTVTQCWLRRRREGALQ